MCAGPDLVSVSVEFPPVVLLLVPAPPLISDIRDLVLAVFLLVSLIKPLPPLVFTVGRKMGSSGGCSIVL